MIEMIGTACFGNFSVNVTVIKYEKASTGALFMPSSLFHYTDSTSYVYTLE